MSDQVEPVLSTHIVRLEVIMFWMKIELKYIFLSIWVWIECFTALVNWSIDMKILFPLLHRYRICSIFFFSIRIFHFEQISKLESRFKNWMIFKEYYQIVDSLNMNIKIYRFMIDKFTWLKKYSQYNYSESLCEFSISMSDHKLIKYIRLLFFFGIYVNEKSFTRN